MKDFKEKILLVPKKPGCYQMKNSNGEIIYVGKAKILQNRLKSYFTGTHDAKTTRMVNDVDNFEYIITSSEIEALLLEINLIKEYRPKYNIMLMDDKTYPYICITEELHPLIIVTRDATRINKRKSGSLFGPYPNVKDARIIVDILNKLYPLRKCSKIPKKECIYYSMKQCLAPCINNVDPNAYTEIKRKISRFLSGNDQELLQLLKQKMNEFADNLEFEKAIEYRKMIESLEYVQSKQKITLKDGVNRDIFGYSVRDGLICIQTFHMRSGKIIMRTGDVFDLYSDISETMLTYITQFYNLKSNLICDEILIPYFENYELLSNVLKTKVVVPIKGIKKQLVDLTIENASNNLETLQKERLIKISKTTSTLEELASILNINYPKRIELFDNSNIQGTNSVSAMVTYIDGVPSKKDYRKYRIKTVQGADDYRTMQEVVMRRYQKVKNENLIKPNLIIADGGKLQVQAIKIVLEKLKMDIDVMGLVKDDKHKTRAIVNSNYEEIPIDKHSNLFLLLEAMQEEVHRFAITFFKKVYTQNAIASALDNIDGIGKNRKKALLTNFDSIEEIKNASIDKLKSLGIPEAVAQNIIKELNK